MNNSRSFIAAGAVLLAFGAPAFAAPATGSFQAWFVQLGPVLEESPGMRAALESAKAAEHGIDAALMQAPFSLGSALEYTHFVSGLGANFVPGSPIAVSSASNFDLRADSRLSFGLRERFLAQLEGSVGLLGAMGNETFASQNLPFSLGLRLQYDVVRGGNRSAENDRARAQAIGALATKLDSWNQRLRLELEFQALASALYGNTCKQKGLEALSARAERALQEAEVQKSAKVLSQTDLLNFRFLRSSVAARVAALASERAELSEQLLIFGAEVSERTREKLGRVDGCEPDTERLMLMKPPEPAILQRIARTTPATAAQRAVQLSVIFAREAQDTDLLPGLSPFLSGRFARPDGFDSEVLAVTGGLSLDWAVPGEKGEQALRALSLQHLAAEQAAVAAELRARSELLRLAARVRARQSLLAVLSNTAADSAALVEILDVRRSIGDIDALNLASAVSGNLDAQFSLVDAAIEIEVGMLQLDTYRENSALSAAELSRLSEGAWTE